MLQDLSKRKIDETTYSCEYDQKWRKTWIIVHWLVWNVQRIVPRWKYVLSYYCEWLKQVILCVLSKSQVMSVQHIQEVQNCCRKNIEIINLKE